MNDFLTILSILSLVATVFLAGVLSRAWQFKRRAKTIEEKVRFQHDVWFLLDAFVITLSLGVLTLLLRGIGIWIALLIAIPLILHMVWLGKQR